MIAHTSMALISKRFRHNPRLEAAADNSPPLMVGEPNREAVRLVQEASVALDPKRYAMPLSTNPEGSMDGVYGNETYITLQKFQIDNKLLNKLGKPDGIAGHDTLHKLDEYMQALETKGKGSTPSPPTAHSPTGAPGTGMCGPLRVVVNGRLTGTSVAVGISGGMDAVFEFDNLLPFEASVEIELRPTGKHTGKHVVVIDRRERFGRNPHTR
jgi:hypothetical protein